MNTPFFRKLRGYAFDPSFSASLGNRKGNEIIFKIRWEPTTPGPCGEYLEVIDYDPTKECFYEPVNLENNYVLADYGLTPSEGNPCFHQQQVYAVVMSIIAQFERALGTKIIWTRINENSTDEFLVSFVDKLRIYPHAMRQQNAYYSPKKLALLFGYFQASSTWNGHNVPGTAVFTCLSPDIVTHEATHAILDSLYPHLAKDTNPDMLAFHEGFADIIALLQRFTFKSVVQEQIRKSRGDLLSPLNLLGDLAIQFGQSVSGHRRALRSYLVETGIDGKPVMIKPDPQKYLALTDAHGRGGLLVAAVFHAFVALYQYRVADLLRLSSNGTGILVEGEIHPDLSNRLADEACNIAGKLMMICIRALDYCPPVDLNFGDYLRALVTADMDYNADDDEGLRFALLESFRNWGIVPTDTNTFSAEALKWKPLEEYFDDEEQVNALKSAIRYAFNSDALPDKEPTKSNGPVINQVLISMEKILRETNRQAIFEESRKLSAEVHKIFNSKFTLYKKNMEKLLGMSFQENDYLFYNDELKKHQQFSAEARSKFQVYKCRPVMRYNNSDGTTSKLLIITFLQKVYVNLAESAYKGYLPNNQYAMRGGATLIIDLADYEIKYAIIKNVASSGRLKRQLSYAMVNLYDTENSALLMQDDEPFAALHLND